MNRLHRIMFVVFIVAALSGAVIVQASAAPQSRSTVAAANTWYRDYHSLKACGVYCWQWHTKTAVETNRNPGLNRIYALWVDCSDTGGWGYTVTVTWCGVAGDSTSADLDVGENFTVSFLFHGFPISEGCWQRIHLGPNSWVIYYESACAWQSITGQ